MKKIITYLVLMFIIFSCEKVNVVETEIKFVENIVVRATLKENSTFTGVSFTKTLPLTEAFDIKKAELKNVTAYLKVNSAQVIPLHYISDGLYKPLYEMEIIADNTYELFAEINGKTIYANTRVPFEPTISVAEFASDSFLTANVNAFPKEVYGSTWVIFPGGDPELNVEAEEFHSIVESSDIQPDFAATRTIVIPTTYRDPLYSNRTYTKVYSFDEQYKDYFKSKNNNQPIEDIFAQGGGPINWNVQGENVIGLFIGMAESKFYKVIK